MVQTRQEVEGCRPNVFRQQLGEVEKALSALRSAGLGEAMAPFRIFERERAKLLKNIGVKLPRVTIPLVRFIGFSPGVIALFFDNESGFMSEARRSVNAEPVYHLVPSETAAKILKHDISPELEEFLMAPDDDIDN